ncbi:MAG: hypothetical protein JSU65_05665, partial [Candidatus Zixiibacteriota bacterium]
MARKSKRTARDSSNSFLDSRLFRLGTRLCLGLVVMVIFLSIVQCTVKKPESPQWTTSLTVPLINRTYTMSELVDRMDQEGLEVLNDSDIVFTISEEVDTFFLDQTELSIDNIDTTVSRTIGVVDINPPVIAPVIVDLGDLVPLVASIPDTSITIENDMPAISSFSTAMIASGEVWVIISNNLAIDLDSITVSLYDIYNPSIPIASGPFPDTLYDGDVDSILFDLSGRSVSNSLRTTIDFHTPGGTSLRAGAKELSTEIIFAGALTVSSATNAAVPAITIADTSRTEISSSGGSTVVHSASFSSGSLQLTITNNTALSATLDVLLPDLYQGGQPLTVQQPVSPFGTEVVYVDLSTCQLHPSDVTAPQEMDLIFQAVTDSNRVDIDQSQSFSVQTTLSSLIFGSVTGVFDATRATIPPSDHEIDVPQGFDGFELVTAVLTLSIANGVQLPGQLDIDVNGSNGKVLNVSSTIQAGTADSAVTTLIVVDTAADFLSPVPDSVRITGRAIFGDGVTMGTISANDYVFATVDIEAPLEIVVNPTTIELDVEDEKIDVEDIDLITEHVQQVRFIYTLENSLPVGVTTNIYLD